MRPVFGSGVCLSETRVCSQRSRLHACSRSGHPREQRVPRAVVLRIVGPRASEPAFQHVQLTHLVDLELLPSMRGTALTLAADLKTEHALDAMPDAVVMTFDDSGSSDLVDK